MRLHVDKLAPLFAGRENHDSIDESEKGVVFAHSDVEAGMMLSATLTLDDVAGFAFAAAEDFHTETFAF